MADHEGSRTAGSRTESSRSDVRLQAELERLEAIRRRVLNVIGHELRTPVATVRGLSEAASTASPERLREDILPALARTTARIERLLDDMLIASGIETALPVDEEGVVDVAPVLREVWGALDSAGSRALHVEGSGEARFALVPFRRAFQRILDNAARYAVGGDPTASVGSDGATVTVVVDVPGPEMHPEEVELAAEPFFRGEHAVMTAPGLGLGLPVARALVEQARGSLRVEARPGGGLRTLVELEAA